MARGALGAVLLVVAIGCASPRSSAPRPGSVIRAVAPDLRGRRFDLASLRGRVVMFDVFASWCVPCRESLPAYQTLQRRYASDLAVVLLSVDSDESALRDFLTRLSIDLRVLRDPSRRIADRLDVSSMPTLFILDRGGRLRARRESYAPSDAPEVERIVRGLLDR